MPGVLPLSGLQIGVETVKGTGVATTRELYPDGTGYIDPGYGFSFHEGMQRGSYSNLTHVTKLREAPAVAYRTTEVSYDELVIPFSFLLGAQVGTGATADKTWTFTPAQISHTFDSYTLNAFDASQCYEIDYGVATGFSLGWGFDDMTSLSMDLIGQAIAKVTVDAVAANNAVKIPSGLWTVKYASAQSGLTGASVLSNTMRSGSLDVDTGLRPRWYGDTSYGFGQVVASGNLGGTLQMTWDSTADAVAQYDLFVAGTPAFFRLKNTGPVLGSAFYDVQIDLCVLWEDVTPIASASDGVIEYTMTGRLAYDATWANSIVPTLVCSLAALP